MRLMFRAGIAASLLATAGSAQAQGANACLTQAEANALFSYVAPEALDSVVKKCATSVPAAAFLNSSAPALVSRYRAEAAPKWPAARTAFSKIMGSERDASKVFDAMPDDAVKALISTSFAVVITNDIKVESCDGVDKLVAALSPLPLQNLAGLITSIMSLTDKGKGNLNLCRGN